MKRGFFFDRDGTVVKAILRPDFIKGITMPFTFDELEFEPYATEMVSAARLAGFVPVMVTNQPDVAYGHLKEEIWEEIHTCIVNALRPDDVRMCRHPREANCFFKKPSPFMIFAAADALGIDPKKSFMIGDTDADMLAGKSAGCTTILIRRSYNGEWERYADIVVESLKEVIEDIFA